MNQKLLNELALQTGGSHFPSVFKQYQKDYVLNVLSELYQVYQQGQDNVEDAYLAIDFWDDIISRFQLDKSEIDMLLKNNKQTA
jgi:hypothetical protein